MKSTENGQKWLNMGWKRQKNTFLEDKSELHEIDYKRSETARYDWIWAETSKKHSQRTKLNFKKSTENGQKRSEMTEYGLKRLKNTFSEDKSKLHEID